MMRRRWITAGLATLLAASVAGTGFAQEATEEPFSPEAEKEFVSWFDYTWDTDEGTLTYTLDDGDDTTETDEVVLEIEDQDGDGVLQHGDWVSAFASVILKGPGVGCLVAQVAQTDFTEDPAEEQVEGEEHQGCPVGLYEWLQTFAGQGDDEGGDRIGPPEWVQGPPAHTGQGDDDVEAEEEGGDADAGPPSSVTTGPPEGVGPGGRP
ncbi:MAG: hypothetical protein ACRDVM_03015 [Acidimicrobiia bacterium]